MSQNLAGLVEDDFAISINQLVKELNQIIADSEAYYGLIYENLPRIERNIELTKQETEILTEYFINVNQLETDLEQNLITESLNQIKNNLKAINDLLLSQKEINKILNLFLNNQEDSEDQLSFSFLLDLIEDTTGILEEVEIIALNAIIFAAKLGDEAKAFNVISNNIHDISSNIEKDFYNIKQLLDQLADWHDNFSLNIKEITDKQKEITADYIIKIDDLFDSISDSVQGINLVLNDLLQNVTEVVAPFEELMSLIQGQDIVRQNLENIAKSLAMIDDKHNQFVNLVDKKDKLSKKEILDYIVFRDRGLQLLDKLADSAFEQLFYSLDEIVETIDEMLVSLAEVKDDAESLTNYFYSAEQEDFINYLADDFSNEDKKEVGLVDSIFAEIFDFSNQFLNVLADIKAATSNLDKELFEENFVDLEKEINNISLRLDRLNKVELLARIELARLDEKDGFGKQIETIVNSVVDSVLDNTDIFYQLRDKLKGNINEFDQIMVRNQKQITKGLTEIKQSLDELHVTNDIINQAILALYKEIENLSDELNQIYAKLKKTAEIRDNGNDILNLITKITKDTEAKKDKYFAEYGVEDWDLESDDLKGIVSNLTTFLEQKTVDEFLNETEVDDNPEGELTLF